MTYNWDEYCVDVIDNETVIKLCTPNNIHDEIQSLYIYCKCLHLKLNDSARL